MKRKLFLLLVAVLTSVAAMAQGTRISGKVADADGEPLLGAGVVVKGTTTGTVTDIDGLFELSVPAGAVLEVSSIGYKTLEIPVGNQTRFEITLEDDNEMLEATVVIGYGTVKRENFTGSVATVKVGDSPISNGPKTTPMDMLRGMTTGLSIGQSGVAGSSPSLQVRGQKSGLPGNEAAIKIGVCFLRLRGLPCQFIQPILPRGEIALKPCDGLRLALDTLKHLRLFLHAGVRHRLHRGAAGSLLVLAVDPVFLPEPLQLRFRLLLRIAAVGLGERDALVHGGAEVARDMHVLPDL